MVRTNLWKKCWVRHVADTIAPAIPVNLRSLSGNGQACVVWDDVLDSDLIGYRVLRAGPNEAFVAVATLVKKAKYVDDGLLSDVSYRYVVQSVDQAQNVSASSNEVIILADGIYMPTKQVEWAQAPVSAMGDGNGDGIIDFKDFLDFTSVFNTQIGDGNYNALFDFDDDGSIRFSDFLAFNKVYGK